MATDNDKMSMRHSTQTADYEGSQREKGRVKFELSEVQTAWTLILMIGRNHCRLLKWFSGRTFRGTVSPETTLCWFQVAIRSGIDGASLILERNI